MSEKKLNIGLFIDTYYPVLDGVITVVNQYANSLKDYANVFVACPRSAKKYIDEFEYKVVRCKAFKVFFLDYYCPTPKCDRAFKKFIKEANLDIVHIHSPFGVGRAGYRAAKRRGIPVIATMHSQFKLDFKRAVKLGFVANWLTKYVINLYNKCDEVWAVNEGTQDILKSYGYKKTSYIMRSGTEMLPQDKSAAKEEIRKIHNIAENIPIFLYVGRINLLKGILFIADSLKELERKGFNYKMIYVGAGQDSEKLEAHIKMLGIQDNVILAGKIMDRVLLAKYYAATDLNLFPSVYDTDGLVKYEGASQSTPTALIDGIAAAKGIIDGYTGYISEANVVAYAEKIVEAIKDKKTYDTVCKNVYNELYKTWPERVKEAYNRYVYLIEQKNNK